MRHRWDEVRWQDILIVWAFCVVLVIALCGGVWLGRPQ